MKLKYIIISIFLCFFSLSLIAQESKLEKANKEYKNFAYIDAQKIFEKVAENGYESADLFKKLGNSYYFNSDYKNAVKWYGKLARKYEKKTTSEYLFRYAQSLKGIESYKESDKYMKKFYELEHKDTRAQVYRYTPNYLDRIDFQSGKFTVKNLAANSKYSDFGPAYYGEKLVFSTSRDTGVYRKHIHKWNDRPFLDLYVGKIEKKTNNVLAVENLSEVLNTKFHESTPVFTKDLKTVYFTRNNYNKGVYKKAKSGINMLKIYKSTKSANGLWTQPVSLGINNDNYVVAHPALNADETKLYFSSNMPGGKGFSDIYVVDIKEDGSLGVPKNMGDEINTEGRESFPYIGSNSNNLYFTSNGHIGLGGLDLYVAPLDENDNVTSVILNLGAPVNSPSDDFAFIFDENKKTGYLSSNRAKGKGDDDIYRVTQVEHPEESCLVTIKGIVIDKDSGDLIPGAQVTLYNTSNKVVGNVIVGDDARYSFKSNCSTNYFLRADKGTYRTHEKLVKTSDEEIEIKENLSLVKVLRIATLGQDLGKILNLNPIYFDYNKHDIRKDAAVELAKVIEVMKEYPNMVIDVRSHTDSRGNDQYNLNLSDNRAKSTVKYISKKGGLETTRLTGSGYGESQLTNECTSDVDCSDEQHQLNRRSEFIITAQ